MDRISLVYFQTTKVKGFRIPKMFSAFASVRHANVFTKNQKLLSCHEMKFTNINMRFTFTEDCTRALVVCLSTIDRLVGKHCCWVEVESIMCYLFNYSIKSTP